MLACFSTDLTGVRGVPPAEPEIMIKPEYEQLSHGVTRDDLDRLKQTAPSVISESLLKKVQEINQVWCGTFFSHFVSLQIKKVVPTTLCKSSALFICGLYLKTKFIRNFVCNSILNT